MPGLKAIADTLDGTAQSRAVSWHAAGVGVSGALSFVIAGLIGSRFGPSAAFFFGGCAAAAAVILAAYVMAATLIKPPAAARRLLDFRPVFRNRAAMGWIAGYTVHTWELAALRAWGVTFLAAVAAGQGAPTWFPEAPTLFTIAGLAGVVVSITGNETAQRWGRARVVTVAMSVAAVLSLPIGWSVGCRSRLRHCS
jgi:hypothetical protein